MSQDVPNLEQFLAQAQNTGSFEESSSFRIDAASAITKLSNFRLPSSYHWVVKVVQWANAVEADSIAFKIGRRRYEVFVEGNPPQSAQQILQDVLAVTTLSDHLVTALFSLAREDTPSFEVEVRGPEHHDAFSYSHREKTFAGSDARRLQSLGLRLTVEGKAWRPLQQHHAYLHKLLYQICWSSPVPLTVDGRKPELRYGNRHSVSFRPGLYPLSFSLAWAWVPPLEGRPEMRLRLPATERMEPLQKENCFGRGYANRVVPDGQMFLVYLPEGPVGAYLNIKTSANSAVVFCCNGVEVDRILVEEPIAQFAAPEMMLKMGFEIYCTVQASETDLSGFRVRNREALAEALVAGLVGQLVKLWDSFLNCPIAFHTRLLKPKHQRLIDTPLATFAGTLVALAAGVYSGGVLAGLAAGIPAAAIYGKLYDLFFDYLSFLGRCSIGSPFRNFGFTESLLELQSRQKIEGVRFRGPPAGDWAAGWTEWPPVRDVHNWALDLLVALRESVPERETIEFRFEHSQIVVRANLQIHPGPLEFLGQNSSLARALVGLARTGPLRITLQTGGWIVEWIDGSAHCSESIVADRGLFLRASYANPKAQGGILQGLKSRFKRRTLPYAEAITELQEQAWLSPVKLDGRPLSSKLSHFPKGRRNVCYDISSSNLPLCLGRRDLPCREGGPWFECPVDQPGVTTPLEVGWLAAGKLDLPGTFLYWGEAAPKLSGVVSLTGLQLANSAVEFVYQGVIVDVFPLYPSELFRKDESFKTRFWSTFAVLGLMKWPVSLRLLVAVESPPEGPARRRVAETALSTYRTEILELADLVLEHLSALSYKWSAEMFKSREASVQQYNVVSTANKSPALRRDAIKNTLKRLPEFLDQHSGQADVR